MTKTGLKLFGAAAALALMAPVAANAAVITIDDFNLTNQEVTSLVFNPPPLDSSELAASEAIGGARDMQAINNTGATDGTNLRVAGGALSFSNIATSRGQGVLSYDGLDGDAKTLDTDGLGGVDFLSVGVQAAFVLDVIEADAALEYTITVTDIFSGVSTFAGVIAEDLDGDREIALLADFTGTADFSKVGAVEFLFNAPVNNLDAAFDNISVASVPVPAALPLFVSSMIGLGLLGRKRRRRS